MRLGFLRIRRRAEKTNSQFTGNRAEYPDTGAGDSCSQWKDGVCPPKDIAEVKNAYEIYEHLNALNLYSADDLLVVHGIMMRDLIEEAGMFRARPVGVVDQEGNNLYFGTLSVYALDSAMKLLD